jgi:hypothetical protein
MAKPTENAEEYFDRAGGFFAHYAMAAQTGSDMALLSHGLANISRGLQQLSIGLRATYNEVEEVKRLLRVQARS